MLICISWSTNYDPGRLKQNKIIGERLQCDGVENVFVNHVMKLWNAFSGDVIQCIAMLTFSYLNQVAFLVWVWKGGRWKNIGQVGRGD